MLTSTMRSTATEVGIAAAGKSAAVAAVSSGECAATERDGSRAEQPLWRTLVRRNMLPV